VRHPIARGSSAAWDKPKDDTDPYCVIFGFMPKIHNGMTDAWVQRSVGHAQGRHGDGVPKDDMVTVCPRVAWWVRMMVIGNYLTIAIRRAVEISSCN
jgi:hypothetical protein